MEEQSKLVKTLICFFEEFGGYTSITTFWQDFSMADLLGNNTVVDTL